MQAEKKTLPAAGAVARSCEFRGRRPGRQRFKGSTPSSDATTQDSTHTRFPRHAGRRAAALPLALSADPQASPGESAEPDTLVGNAEFWNHTRDGLAVFAASGIFQVYGTQRPLPELAVVADSFHTKPLRRLLQTTDRYQVLGLTRDAIRLFEGNRDALDEIDPAPGVPRTLTEALGEELTEPHSTVASYGGGAGAGGGAMHHGHGGKSPEVEIDDERFFRAVARAVTEHHSQPSKLPLILAALPEHQALFRRVSHNSALLEGGIATNPDALSTDQLREQAWEVFAPQYQARLKALDNDAAYARSKETGSDDLTEVAGAAVAGRVQTLLMEAGRQLPGRLDPKTGEVTQGELDDPQTDDVLDDLADLVSEMGGEVVIVPGEA